MVTFLVDIGWLAILAILLPDAGLPFAALGYVSAAIGITVPVRLLQTLRAELDTAESADGS